MSLRHSPRTRIAAATDWRRRCSADEGRRSGALLVAAVSAINNALDTMAGAMIINNDIVIIIIIIICYF